MTDARRASTTILAVDDNDGVLNVVVSMLRSARFKVLSAGSGPAALQIASDPSMRIDLLLSDIDMPGMCGSTLAGLVKQIRPEIRLIFMSGGNHNLPFATTDFAYLAKPFLLDALIKTVEETLDTS